MIGFEELIQEFGPFIVMRCVDEIVIEAEGVECLVVC
jgi:hypothetical protein